MAMERRDGERPQLTEGAAVHLSIDAMAAPVPCTVVAFLGSVILARRDAAVDPEAAERLLAGVSGYLLVEHEGRPRALRGSVRATGGAMVAIRISDGFQLGQRRTSTRVALALDAQLVLRGMDAPPVLTTTIDVSTGGVQVRRPAGMRVWPRYELTLSGTPLAEPVVADVAPARALPDALGLRFLHIDPAHEQRLAEVVVVHAAGLTPRVSP
jgi:hypothetical protein